MVAETVTQWDPHDLYRSTYADGGSVRPDHVVLNMKSLIVNRSIETNYFGFVRMSSTSLLHPMNK